MFQSERAKIQNYQSVKARLRFYVISDHKKMAAPDIAEATEKIDNRTKVYLLLPCIEQSADFRRTQCAAVAAEVVELAVEETIVTSIIKTIIHADETIVHRRAPC